MVSQFPERVLLTPVVLNINALPVYLIGYCYFAIIHCAKFWAKASTSSANKEPNLA